jgi:sortase A
VIGVVAAVCILFVLIALVAVVARLRGARAPSPAPVAAAGTTGRGDPMDRVVGVLRRNRWLRRSLSVASAATMAVAVGLIGFPYFTNLYAEREQSRLDGQLSSQEIRDDYDACAGGAGGADCFEEGDSLTRIIIPALDVDVVVVEGTSESALRAGAGHYRDTPLPCEDGNVAIAGHRTTYGRPFANLDLLRPGDEITLQTPVSTCTYLVGSADMPEGQQIVTPDDISVIANTPGVSQLTLTTCHPKGSARERLIVQATLTGAAAPVS